MLRIASLLISVCLLLGCASQFETQSDRDNRHNYAARELGGYGEFGFFYVPFLGEFQDVVASARASALKEESGTARRLATALQYAARQEATLVISGPNETKLVKTISDACLLMPGNDLSGLTLIYMASGKRWAEVQAMLKDTGAKLELLMY